MADTTFVNGVTLTDEDWFNDVNRLHYTIFNDPANAIVALANLNAAPPGQGILLNGKVVTSVSSNALTIAIKGADGNDPSSTNPVSVAFRSSTLTESGLTIRKLTAALSVVVSSGSTLGHASNAACHLFAYLIDNSGTVELAVSNLPPDYPGTFANTRLISTTAEGGAGAADSATGIYSTTARSNVPWICVAMLKSNQATAGTWATAIQQVDQAPFVIPDCRWQVSRAATQSIGAGGPAKVTYDTKAIDPFAIFDATTNNRAQPNVAGDYDISTFLNCNDTLTSGEIIIAMLYKNGSITGMNLIHVSDASNSNHGVSGDYMITMNGTTDYLEIYAQHTAGGSRNIEGSTRIGFGGSRRVL